MSQCSSCDAEIVWVETQAGKNMPIDPDPAENGNLIKVSRKAGKFGMVDVVRFLRKGEDAAGKDRFVSHFATCPQAKEHRRADS